MTTIEAQIKVITEVSKLVKEACGDPENSSFLREALSDSAQTLVGYEKNEQVAERALKRVKELEEELRRVSKCYEELKNQVTIEKLLNP